MVHRKYQVTRRPSGGRVVARIGASAGAQRVAKYLAKTAAQRVKKYMSSRKIQKSKPKFQGPKVTHDHDGINSTSHTIVLNKKSKKKKKIEQWHTYQQQNSENITGAAGAQAIGLINADFTTVQMSQTDLTTSTGATPLQYWAPLFNFKYDQQAGTALSGVSGYVTPWNGSVPNANRVYGVNMFVKHVYYDFMFANASNAAMVMDLYAVVRKKDTAVAGNYTVDPFDSRTAGLMTEVTTLILNKRSVGKPLAVQPVVSSGSYTGPTFGDYNITNYGFNPFQLKGFRETYKCKFHKVVSLDGGAVHRFNVMMHVNKWVNEERVRGGSNNAINGLTVQWFVICKGAPAVIETADTGSSIPYRQVTPAATQISYTLSKKIKFGFASGTNAEESWIQPGFPLVDGTSTTRFINSEDAEVAQIVVNAQDTV